MGDGRAEGLSVIGDAGQAAIPLTPDVDGMHTCIFESSHLEGSCVGNLLHRPRSSQLMIKLLACLGHSLYTRQWQSMFITVLTNFSGPGLVEGGDMGREELGLTSSQFMLQNWTAPQKADPSLASAKRVPCPADREQTECNKALVPYLCGSSQLLRMSLPFAGNPPAPQEVIPRPSGLLGCGHLKPGMQRWDPKQIPRMLFLRDHRTSRLLAVRASLSSTVSRDSHHQEKQPLPLLSPPPHLASFFI